MRGAVISTSAHQGIPTTFALRRGIAVPRFMAFINALMVTGVHRQQNMKKIILGLIIALVLPCIYAQNDVTQFLGIPVDGSKSEMIQKLKAKGFRSNMLSKDILDGVFNGEDVSVHIATNGDKVCRIMVCDANSVDERAIQIRFNKLCLQFEKNPKYISLKDNQLIPDDEDISYEILVNKKRYEAIYYQRPVELADSASMYERLTSIAMKKYTTDELLNPTDEIKNDLIRTSLLDITELCSKKPVWFMISKYLNKYYITMFYDNEYNRADGEDL